VRYYKKRMDKFDAIFGSKTHHKDEAEKKNPNQLRKKKNMQSKISENHREQRTKKKGSNRAEE